jgi:hypothetical protein
VEVATESIEVQALRLKLQLFASQQTDQTIRRQCHAVDKKLAEVIEGTIRPLGKYWQTPLNSLKRPCGARRFERATVT